jgi:hypothetical protein
MHGAAPAPVVGAAVLFLFQLVVGNRLCPVPYEYGRLARLAIVAGLPYAIGIHVRWRSFFAALTGHMTLRRCTPRLLSLTSFFEPGERRRPEELFRAFPRGSSPEGTAAPRTGQRP